LAQGGSGGFASCPPLGTAMARDAAKQVVNWLAAKIRTLEKRISELEHALPTHTEVRSPLRASAPAFCPQVQVVLAELLPPAAEHEETKELDVAAEHQKLPREEPAPEELEPATELEELRELEVVTEPPGLPQEQTPPEEPEPAAKLEEPRELKAVADRQEQRKEHVVPKEEPTALHEEPGGLDVATKYRAPPWPKPAPEEQESAAELRGPEELEPAAGLEDSRELEADAEHLALGKEPAVQEAEPSVEHVGPKEPDSAAEHQKLTWEEPVPGVRAPAADQEGEPEVLEEAAELRERLPEEPPAPEMRPYIQMAERVRATVATAKANLVRAMRADKDARETRDRASGYMNTNNTRGEAATLLRDLESKCAQTKADVDKLKQVYTDATAILRALEERVTGTR